MDLRVGGVIQLSANKSKKGKGGTDVRSSNAPTSDNELRNRCAIDTQTVFSSPFSSITFSALLSSPSPSKKTPTINVAMMRLAYLEDRVKSPRDIALLRIDALRKEGSKNGEGFAAHFVPLLQDSLDSWWKLLEQGKESHENFFAESSSMGFYEEKKDESELGVESNSCRFAVAGAHQTDMLYRVLSIHATLSQLDPTLGEEIGRQGSHMILSHLIKFDMETLPFEEDRDAVMECQDLACEIATMTTGGSFPLRKSPFPLDDLLSRLPLTFDIKPLRISGLQNQERDSHVILVRQVTSRQSAQEDVGFVMWPSAVVLSRWLVSHPFHVEGKSVLELGAGCGLVGLVAARLQNGQSENSDGTTIITDFNPVVLENMEHNIALNGAKATTAKVDFYAQSGRDHHWVDGHGSGRDQVDVILAADIICQPDDATAAANSIHDALKPTGVAVVVCADSRHRYGVDHFEGACRTVGLVIETQRVSEWFQDDDDGLHLTAGYVEGMELTMFFVRKVTR